MIFKSCQMCTRIKHLTKHPIEAFIDLNDRYIKISDAIDIKNVLPSVGLINNVFIIEDTSLMICQIVLTPI